STILAPPPWSDQRAFGLLRRVFGSGRSSSLGGSPPRALQSSSSALRFSKISFSLAVGCGEVWKDRNPTSIFFCPFAGWMNRAWTDRDTGGRKRYLISTYASISDRQSRSGGSKTYQ